MKNISMKKSAFISDIIFAFFTVFLFTICLFRYYRISLIVAFLLALLCGILASGACAAFLQNKRKYHFLKKSEEAVKDKFSLHLVLLSDEQKTELFQKILSTEEIPARRVGKLRLCTHNTFYFLKFTLAPVCADDVAVFARLKTNKQKILLCLQIDDSARALCKQLQINVNTAQDVYVLAKSKDALPEHFLGDENTSQKTHRKIRLWCSKSNARRFLVSGALILLTSFLTPFSYYYIVMGSLLFLAAAFVRIFGRE